MRCFHLIAAVLALGAPATPAISAPAPTVAYRIPGQDPLSVKFRSALDARIDGDKELKRAASIEVADLKIESPARNVDWDTLGGKMVVIYILNIWGKGEKFRLSGVCYADNMDKCARELLNRSKHYVLGL